MPSAYGGQKDMRLSIVYRNGGLKADLGKHPFATRSGYQEAGRGVDPPPEDVRVGKPCCPGQLQRLPGYV
jgi:hypothetical protein